MNSQMILKLFYKMDWSLYALDGSQTRQSRVEESE